jgi:hypothetical protein
MTTIHLIDGEKGGTGKSWMARTMHHVFDTHNVAFFGIDADIVNPSYHNIYPDVQLIPFTPNANSEANFQAIFELAEAADVIVNLPPQAHAGMVQWFAMTDFIAMAQQRGITIKKWWISDGEEESYHCFLKSLAAHPNGIQHVLVQNHGRCRHWNYFEHHELIQAAIRHHQIPVIELPRMHDQFRIVINHQRLDFEAALKLPQFGFVGRANIAHYLKHATAALKIGGAFGQPSDQAMLMARSPMPPHQDAPFSIA